MQLFYAPGLTPPLHTLGEEESKHCVRVLRLGRGDTLHITDGEGNLFCCRIENDDPKRCTVRVVSVEREFERLPYALTMAVAPTKNADRFEWFLEKATEVGVGEIIPLETARSERRVFKPERSEKVITAAMKQSLKAYRPRLHPLTPVERVLTAPFAGRKFIAHCADALAPEGKRFLARTLRPQEAALILIGPEGDFTPEEVAAALSNGFEEITLGRQRLRTETAALAAVVMVAAANGSDCTAQRPAAGTCPQEASGDGGPGIVPAASGSRKTETQQR